MIENLPTAVSLMDITMKFAKTVSRAKYILNSLKRPLKIAIFGSSGSGKSCFLSLFNGQKFPKESTRYNEEFIFTLPNGRKIRFVDCPGQTSYLSERNKIRKRILKGDFHAIINVVCYGYNETENMDLSIFDDQGNVRRQFLEDNRRIELNQLDEWINDIDNNSKIKWILTLINKEDIWKETQEEVMTYYREGEYHRKINALSRVCPIHTRPHCSIISPFGGRPMMLNLSESQKVDRHLELIKQLQEYTKPH